MHDNFKLKPKIHSKSLLQKDKWHKGNKYVNMHENKPRLKMHERFLHCP